MTSCVLSALVSVAVVVLFYIVYRLVRRVFRRGKDRFPVPFDATPRIAIVLGSGGHTGEMLTLLDSLEKSLMKSSKPQWTFFVAESDTNSIGKLQIWLKSRPHASYSVIRIPRSREVGQTYVSAVFSSLKAFFVSLIKVHALRPHCIITNGPGTAVPVVFAGLCLEIQTGNTIALFLAESFCRTETVSLTSRILMPFADEFFVYWPKLHEQYPRSVLLAL